MFEIKYFCYLKIYSPNWHSILIWFYSFQQIIIEHSYFLFNKFQQVFLLMPVVMNKEFQQVLTRWVIDCFRTEMNAFSSVCCPKMLIHWCQSYIHPLLGWPVRSSASSIGGLEACSSPSTTKATVMTCSKIGKGLWHYNRYKWGWWWVLVWLKPIIVLLLV